MAKSKFDTSLLTPVDDKQSSSGWNQSLLTPVENEEQFQQPKQESFFSKLPRNIAAGLAGLGHGILNTPHDITQGLEDLGGYLNENFPNSLGLKAERNLPKLSQFIPHQKELNFAQMLGQEGNGTLSDSLIQGLISHSPEIAGLTGLARGALKNFPVTAKGITNKLSKDKRAVLNEAKQEYDALFNAAKEKGITHALPPESALENRARITANSQIKHNRSLNEYIKNPTLENAHRAQSELGSLERHLDSIANKNGLTPTQHKTLKAVQEARADIKKEMFSENVLGSNPELGEHYKNLTNKYREEVIPYTRLKELTDVENKKMLPKKALNKLLKDDQFIIELSRRYPGLMLHTPKAKSLGRNALALGVGISGYEGLKKLLK